MTTGAPTLTARPAFKSGHTLYVEAVKDLFRDGCRWLDAGGGHQIFHDSYDGEADLVRRSAVVVACDYDADSLAVHQSVANRVRGDLSRLPLRDSGFDFVTCGMVVEHLSEPARAIAELGRVMDHGGVLVIHTVNLWGYATLMAMASKLIPFGLRRRLIARATGRQEDDIFPTLYRCNTGRTMTRLVHRAGLTVRELRYLQAGPVFRWGPLRAIEVGYRRVIDVLGLRLLRGQLLVIAQKPEAPR